MPTIMKLQKPKKSDYFEFYDKGIELKFHVDISITIVHITLFEFRYDSNGI